MHPPLNNPRGFGRHVAANAVAGMHGPQGDDPRAAAHDHHKA
jgi:hypothetical protein